MYHGYAKMTIAQRKHNAKENFDNRWKHLWFKAFASPSPPGSVLTLQVKFRNDSLRLRGITILRLHLWHLQIFNNSTIAWSCASFWVEPCSTGWRHIQREQRKLGRCSHTPKIPELFLVVPQEYLPYNYKIIKAEPFHDFHLTTDSQVPMTIIEKAMWMICGKYLRFSSIN